MDITDITFMDGVILYGLCAQVGMCDYNHRARKG